MPFNAPPNWPSPPPGWLPTPEWTPPHEWGPAPDNWDFGDWQPPPPSPRGLRRATSTFIKHPMWTTLGAFIGGVGVVISGIQIYQATQSPPADLEVAVSSVGGPQQIPAEGYDSAQRIRDTKIPVGIFKANPVDLTLKNNGGAPALVTQVVADVKHFEVLNDCTQAGAGPAAISAEYAIRIPKESGEVILGEYIHDVRFEVKPGAVDRMALTIGPEIESFYSYPYVLGVGFRLIDDGGNELNAGSYVIVGNHRAIESHLSSRPNPDCAKINLEKLEPVLAYQSVKAPELGQLCDTYRAWLAE